MSKEDREKLKKGEEDARETHGEDLVQISKCDTITILPPEKQQVGSKELLRFSKCVREKKMIRRFQYYSTNVGFSSM